MILTNAHIIMKDEVIHGTVVIEQDLIKSVETGRTHVKDAIDLEGAYLAPGLVELHTDNLDKFFAPRPKVDWPAFSAMRSHDALIIASGITTVLDAISIGDERDGGHRLNNLTKMLDVINYTQSMNLNRAEHRLHLRCELPSEFTLPLFEYLIEKEDISLVSLMDHSPGQRQYTSIEKYREYFQGKYHFTDEKMAEYEIVQCAKAQTYSHTNRHTIANLCKEANIALASHDDATREHVLESKEIGCSIAEFPTTLEAALASQARGIKVLMGAPNIIRGGSHSGNISASSLASQSALDILSSDYYPQSLLEAAYKVASDPTNSFTLPQAIQLVTYNPAASLGLFDRGEIIEGKLADLVMFRPHLHQIENTSEVMIERVWCKGKQVF
ncbi:alpha-D-ribose 1-methylphosphonate 5-triphosphate diphosphatase [Thorsellia anophelis]|uniref:Ribophosphonate triphosphate hydrolase n=1 Tax=Thorsellia anophelis DSM 18579 TaxID=1123402 RepID=A0A1I0ASD8_9GAMM|nr:alpha-D-ribose 1-methylphosphonate 5-triphosphate diphosphatase [Thorsellia anophelis]SES96842.1 ribophosphonate triphosphate hydrolase [Thorsellia anophelis DSM 18579]